MAAAEDPDRFYYQPGATVRLADSERVPAPLRRCEVTIEGPRCGKYRFIGEHDEPIDVRLMVPVKHCDGRLVDATELAADARRKAQLWS